MAGGLKGIGRSHHGHRPKKLQDKAWDKLREEFRTGEYETKGAYSSVDVVANRIILHENPKYPKK